MLGKSNYALLSVFWKTIYMSKSNNLFPKKNAVAAVAGKRVNCLWNLLDVLPMLCMNLAALHTPRLEPWGLSAQWSRTLWRMRGAAPATPFT